MRAETFLEIRYVISINPNKFEFFFNDFDTTILAQRPPKTIREVLQNKMANRIKMVCRDRDCYCKPKKATHSASPPPPAVDLELLQRYIRLREDGKFLDLEINCSDGSTRSVHKFILNSLSVNLGRSILACKYICNRYHLRIFQQLPYQMMA